MLRKNLNKIKLRFSHKVYLALSLITLIIVSASVLSYNEFNKIEKLQNNLKKYYFLIDDAYQSKIYANEINASILEYLSLSTSENATKFYEKLDVYRKFISSKKEKFENNTKINIDKELISKFGFYERIFENLESEWSTQKRLTNTKLLMAVTSHIQNINEQLYQTTKKRVLEIEEKTKKDLSISKKMILIVGIFSIFLSIAIGLLINRMTVPHILSVTKSLNKLKNEDLDFDIKKTNRKDEIGDLNNSLESLKSKINSVYRYTQVFDDLSIGIMVADKENFIIQNANKKVKEILKPLEEKFNVSMKNIEGTCIDKFHENPERIRKILENPENLPHVATIEVDIGFSVYSMRLEITALYNKDGSYYGPMIIWQDISNQVSLLNNFDTNVKNVVEELIVSCNNMQEMATTMSTNAEETNNQSRVVKQSSDIAHDNTQNIASAIEEMTTSIKEIAQQAYKQEQSVKNMKVNLKTSDNLLNDLGEKSKSVSNIVSLIKNIAEQTNLLALNATIEAARAGEAGKGFAVVANEVKTLATQTQNATKTIEQEISEILESIQKVVDSSATLKDNISEIDYATTASSSSIEEQSAVANEIAKNVSQASDLVREVSQNMETVLTASNETGSEAEKTLNAIREVNASVVNLKNKVDEFLKKL